MNYVAEHNCLTSFPVDQRNTLRGIICWVLPFTSPGPPSEVGFHVSTFLSVLNVTVTDTFMGGLLSTYFVI